MGNAIWTVKERDLGVFDYWAAYAGGEKNQNRRTKKTYPNRCHYPLMTYLSFLGFIIFNDSGLGNVEFEGMTEL